MPRTSASKRSRRTAGIRRWRVPPPVRGSVSPEGPEGIAVLEEVQGLLGLLLWATLRSTAAWADRAGDEPDDLFPEGSGPKRFSDILEVGPPPLLETSLGELAMILERPAQTDPGAAGTAAMRIAGWAEEDGYRKTAAEFYQLAANVCPANPRYALAAARAARDLADYGRAETWLQRSIGLSRQETDWSIYADAYLAYGTMMHRRGNMPAARKHFQRALRRSDRHGLKEIRARAYHDLFVVELECERFEEAEGLAIQALRSYPKGHSSLPRLANDLSYVWLKREEYASAFALLQAVLPTADLRTKPYVLGGLALAAGTCGRTEALTRAIGELQSIPEAPGVAEAWAEAARGAMRNGMLSIADHAIAIAERISTARGEHKVQFLVDEIILELERAKSMRQGPETSRPEAWDVSPIATEIIEALQPG